MSNISAKLDEVALFIYTQALSADANAIVTNKDVRLGVVAFVAIIKKLVREECISVQPGDLTCADGKTVIAKVSVEYNLLERLEDK